MRAMVVVRAIGQVRVDVVVGVRVVEGSRPRVVREQRVAAGETLLGLELHRVVVVARIAAVVAEVLAPAELLEERLALVGRQRAESFDRRLVEVVVAAEAGEHVRAFVADVGGFDGHVAAQLMLHRQVPGVVRRQAQLLREDERGHAVRQHRASVRPFGCLLRMVAGSSARRPLRQVEDRVEVARRLQRLNAQHRQVLRHVVTEDGSEDADVVAAAVAHAHHGLVGDAVGDAQRAAPAC